jgi:hypothetical protein
MLERVEMDSYGFLGLWKDKPHSHLLTSGTGSHLVCQVMPASSSTSYPDVGIMRDRQGCHNLPPTPQPWDMRQTKVASSLDITSTLSTTTLAFAKGYPSLSGPSTRASATGTDDEPMNN